MLRGYFKDKSFKSADIVRLLKGNESFLPYLPVELQEKFKISPVTFAIALGKALGRRKDQVFGKERLYLRKGDTKSGGSVVWYIDKL